MAYKIRLGQQTYMFDHYCNQPRAETGAIHMAKRRSSRIVSLVILSFIIIVGIGCSALYISFYAIDGASPQQGKQRANELLASLEKHKGKTGKYPSELNQLVPEYLPAIPHPAWRYAYTYEACQHGEGYTLYFRQAKDADNYCGYSSKAQQWTCTDSLPPYFYDSPCQ
ncbi:MAG: hypothetical protein R3E79_08035 [Caldilineaceae bacterium]